jgi:hypothetical protein
MTIHCMVACMHEMHACNASHYRGEHATIHRAVNINRHAVSLPTQVAAFNAARSHTTIIINTTGQNKTITRIKKKKTEE